MYKLFNEIEAFWSDRCHDNVYFLGGQLLERERDYVG